MHDDTYHLGSRAFTEAAFAITNASGPANIFSPHLFKSGVFSAQIMTQVRPIG